jgi:LysR family transcriptional regulator, benzoate and cis,cis-muconate-responsive activator of ben and cat genes
MELRHFRFVVTLAEELHFGRAAARLNISQPPFSRQIRQLEEELGVKLFHRNRRQIKVTEAGRMFTEQARQILAEAEQARHLVAEVARSTAGQLKVGFPSSAESGILVNVFETFGREYPNVRIVLRSMSTADQVQALRSRELQVGFLRLPVYDATAEIEVIAREPVVVALPERHRFALHKRLHLDVLDNETYIMFPRNMNPGYYDFLLEACRSAGFTVKVAREADTTCTALALVAAGLGIALLPASAQDLGRHGVVFRSLEPPATTEMAVAYNRDSSKALTSFLEVVRRIAGRKAAPPRRLSKEGREKF